jgi:predicted helicase
MVASVEHVLEKHFNKSLAEPGVNILDPFTGTGNFIVNLMHRISASALKNKFHQDFHANEVMLLPYYVACMNIEHAYLEVIGTYEPFKGICLVDTFQIAEKEHLELELFSKLNSERVGLQQKATIDVILGNPPYNAGQVNENDNNKNRKYPDLDRRVSVTYGAQSTRPRSSASSLTPT